jgi:hypothetical protein
VDFDPDMRYSYPVIVINEELHRMVPLPEFIDRLGSSQSTDPHFRACDNLIESERAESMLAEIK